MPSDIQIADLYCFKLYYHTHKAFRIKVRVLCMLDKCSTTKLWLSWQIPFMYKYLKKISQGFFSFIRVDL